VAILMRTFAATLLALGLAAAAARAEPVVIVHPRNPVQRLSRDEARKIILGDQLSWPNADVVDLIELRSDDHAIAAALLALTHKTLAQIHARWNRLVFSGQANPPQRAATEAEVRSAVARSPGGIAVIDSANADSSVKIVLRLGAGE
jgi:ABC-type phosphate transport system substrate-binding protein